MSTEPSTARLWLIRVVIPAILIGGAGFVLTRRSAENNTASGVSTDPGPVTADVSESAAERLHKIGLAINEATARSGRPPANLAELRPYIADHGNPDRLGVSPTDGQPFVLLWGIDVRTAAYDTVLAYERSGAGGRRFVLTASGVVQMTDDELAAAGITVVRPGPAGP